MSFRSLSVLCALVLSACLDAIPADTLTPEESGSVVGVVKDQCTNAGLSGVTVTGGGKQSVSDAQGRFKLEGLEPGSLQLTVTRDDYLHASPQVVITQGQQASLDITLAPVPKQHPVNKVDVLFVVDNSGSMGEEQVALGRQFPDFLTALTDVFSDIRVGVISTDLGVGTHKLPSCEVTGGDGGNLQNTPRVAGCSAPTDPYIEVIDGKAINVAGGDPAAAFSCIVKLGTGGCGFEQTLEAARMALEPAANPGFVRDDAMLAVVVISDEDDCSAADTNLYNPEDSAMSDPLGPLTSFRCFEFGVTCDVNDRDQSGIRSDCKPSAQMLFDIKRYVDFFGGLKSSPEQVFFAAVSGPTDRVEVGKDGDNPTLRPSCQSASGIAVPAIRLKAVVDALNPGVSPKPFFSICEAAIPMGALAQQLVNATTYRSCP